MVGAVLGVSFPGRSRFFAEAERSAADRDGAALPPFSPPLWAAG
jgi:hypothetical protein